MRRQILRQENIESGFSVLSAPAPAHDDTRFVVCGNEREILVGIALFLTHLAQKKIKASELRASYPDYFMAKEKAALSASLDVDGLLASVASEYAEYQPSTIDGVKIDFESTWVHLRKSNTEPIVRIYTEAPTQEEADALAATFVKKLEAFS